MLFIMRINYFFYKKIIKMVDFRKNKLYNVFVNNFIKNQKNEIIIKTT